MCWSCDRLNYSPGAGLAARRRYRLTTDSCISPPSVPCRAVRPPIPDWLANTGPEELRASGIGAYFRYYGWLIQDDRTSIATRLMSHELCQSCEILAIFSGGFSDAPRHRLCRGPSVVVVKGSFLVVPRDVSEAVRRTVGRAMSARTPSSGVAASSNRKACLQRRTSSRSGDRELFALI